MTNKEWDIDFISKEQFLLHVSNTLDVYINSFKPFNLERFNRNQIDAIKLIFDKETSGLTIEEMVQREVARQRDKTNNNGIGYFHQRLFSCLPNCRVPKNGEEGGWDVIVENPDGIQLSTGETVSRVYAEVKNKFNTMNDSSATHIYEKMWDQISKDKDSACILVEVISKGGKSQDIGWERKGKHHNRIRRMSIDQFYKLVTGQPDAFYKICQQLPNAIQENMKNKKFKLPEDTVLSELNQLKDETESSEIESALLKLGFQDYLGFK